MPQDRDSAISSCLSRLDNLMQSVARLQRAHTRRSGDPGSERTFQEIRLAKTAIETEYQALRLKLTQIRESLADETEQIKSTRRRNLTAKVFSRYPSTD